MNNLDLNQLQTLTEALPWYSGLAGIGLFVLYVLIWGMVIGASIGSAVVFGWLMWVIRWWIIGAGGVCLLLMIIAGIYL
jgi:hypothetical protein